MSRSLVTIAMGVCLLAQTFALPVNAQVRMTPQLPALERTQPQPVKVLSSAAELLSTDNRPDISASELDQLIPLLGGSKVITMKLHGVPLPDAFRALAAQAGFSVIVDESVEGDVNIDFQNVTIQEALDSFKGYGNLAYRVEGKSLIVAKADSDRAKMFMRSSSQIIPLRNANAKILSQILTQTLFGNSTQQNQGAMRNVGYDYHTNSLVVVGTQNDIKTVQNLVQSLDLPRETRTWRLSHGNAVDVAGILSASLFNEGIPSFMVGSGGTSGGGSTGGSQSGGINLQSASLNVEQEKIQEASQTTEDSGSSGSSGSSSGGSSTLNSALTLRARVKEDQRATVSPQGAIIVPDSRLNTITIMGTAEQIAMAEAIIPTLDRKVPQVAIELTVIELNEKQLRQFQPRVGANAGDFVVGNNNSQGASSSFSNAIGVPTAINEIIVGYTTNPIQRLKEFQYQIDMLDQQEKLKLVANPTIITAHDNEAIINVSNEIIRKNELTINAAGDLVGSEAEIGDVGVLLNILPKVGANGNVSLRIRPTVSSISQRLEDNFGGQINLVSKRRLLVQNVVLKEGESFILGGLTSDSDSDVKGKIPGIADIPGLGQLAKTSNRNKNRTEVIIVITPHILNDESDAARLNAQSPLHPVTLPDPGKQQPEGNAYVPVSNAGYQTLQNPNRFLPQLQPATALDGRVPATGASEKHHSQSHKVGLQAPSKTSAEMMLMMHDPKTPMEIPESMQPKKKKKKMPSEKRHAPGQGSSDSIPLEPISDRIPLD